MTFACRIKTLLTCLCLPLMMVAQTSGSPVDSIIDAKTPDVPPYIILVDEDFEFDGTQLPDSVFNSIAGRVIYKVNKTNLNTNSPLIVELRDSILPMANSKGWMLEGIELRGAASPEGPYWNNVRLSKGRAEALRKYIVARLDSVSDNDFAVSTIAEDYSYLLWMLQRDNDPAAVVVEKIIDECGGAEHEAAIKKKLRRVDGGKLWWRLLRQYYPDVRYARMVMYMRPVNEPKKRVKIEVDLRPDDLVIEEPKMPEFIDEKPKFKLSLPIAERPHLLSVGTNVLYDGFYMPQYGWAPSPNVQVEIYPKHGNFTFQASFMFPYYQRWSKHKFFQIRDYHLEVRRYFKPGKHHTGLYLGAYANANIYGIGLSKDKGWEGEGIGGALKIGYVLPLGNSRWRVDFHAAAGTYYTRFDPYVYGNPITGEIDGDYYYDYTGSIDHFKKRNHQLLWFGPTEVGVTFTYDFLFWKLLKPGCSVLRNEVVF